MDDAPPTDAPDDIVAATTRNRRRTLALVGLGMAAALAVIVAVSTGGDGRDDPDTTDIEVEGPPTSAATGAEGTRELDVIPDELPAGLLLEDASGIEGTVARSGDDWSAAVVFDTSTTRAEAESQVEQAAAGAGFQRTRASTAAASKVLFYSGDDGSTMTVTLAGPEEGPLTIGGVLVSP